jgi:shikimate kinase
LLAVGGGALLRPSSLALAVSRATIVTLWARDAILSARSLGGRRPLARDGTAMEILLRSRANHYMLLPNHIDTSLLTLPDTAEAIASVVRALHGIRG